MGKERTKVDEGRQRQRFNREFKLEAVRLLELGQKPAAQLALELGVRRNLLYKWQKDFHSKADQAFRGQGRKPRDQQSEMERLRVELRKVTEERDILKKISKGPGSNYESLFCAVPTRGLPRGLDSRRMPVICSIFA
jgi:transposase